MGKVARAFEVEKLDGEVEVVVHDIMREEKTNKFLGFNKRTVKEPAGYMVYFPHGHSIRVESEQRLKEMGFADRSGFVDLDTGELVEEAGNVRSLKEMVLSKATKRARRGAMMEE